MNLDQRLYEMKLRLKLEKYTDGINDLSDGFCVTSSSGFRWPCKRNIYKLKDRMRESRERWKSFTHQPNQALYSILHPCYIGGSSTLNNSIRLSYGLQGPMHCSKLIFWHVNQDFPICIILFLTLFLLQALFFFFLF